MSAGRFDFRVTWRCASTIPSLATIREMRNSLARRGIFILQATCTPSSDACWRGNSRRCGALSIVPSR